MSSKDHHKRKDSRWLLGYSLFLALLTAVPYLIAFGQGDPDWVFSGFLFGVDDGNSYIAKMLTGSNGAWTFQTPYTTYPQTGLIFVYLPYLLLGKLAAPPELHFQLVLLFQAYRFAAVFLVVFSAYDFIAYFEQRTKFRRFGTILLTTGGGLGWVFIFFGGGEWLGSLPLDFYSPETFGFLAVFGLPHLAVGRALLLWGIVVFLKHLDSPKNQYRAGVSVGLLWLGSGLFNPINPAIGWLITAVFLGTLRIAHWDGSWPEAVKTAMIAGVVSLPVVGYSFVASITDPFFRSWAMQNSILSPHPLHYLLAFGIYLPWAISGGKRLLGRGAGVDWYPLIWVVMIPILAYMPLSLQRRLPEAAFAAVVVLTLRGLGRDEHGEAAGLNKALLLVPAFFTSVILIAGSLAAAWVPSKPIFRPSAEVHAFEYLGSVSEPDAVVLSTKELGNVLPAFVPVRVVIGHGPETINFAYVQQRVDDYFSGSMDTSEQIELLEEFGVDYVIGLAEITPAPPGGERIYSEDGYVIFKVR